MFENFFLVNFVSGCFCLNHFEEMLVLMRNRIMLVVMSAVAALFVPPTGVPALVCSMLYMNGDLKQVGKEKLRVASLVLDVCSLIIACIVAVRLLVR